MNIVFDLDGTLIDSAADIQSAASTVLEQAGKPGLSLEETRSFIGEGAAVFVQRMMAARDIEVTATKQAQLHAEFIAHYELAVDKAVFYPGVIEALAVLQADGHSLGLCTNKPERPTRAVLRHMKLDSIFQKVMAGGMINSSKPEPAMLLQTLDALGGGPTLYVGDSETDAETALRAGIPFALFSQGYRKSPVSEIRHDYVFDHFESLCGIVEQAQRSLY
jgi:phosphoglycolate phosphatase